MAPWASWPRSAAPGRSAPRPILSIAVDDGVTALQAGASTTYKVMVTNAGPMPVVGAAVVGAASQTLASQSWTCAVMTNKGNATACGAASGTGALSDMANLDVGSVLLYMVSAATPQTATGSLIYTVTVAAPAGVTDPNMANNSATDTDSISSGADLSVQLTPGPGPLFSGVTIPFIAQVHNGGTSDASNVKLTVILPDQTTLAAVPTDDGWQCIQTGQQVQCSRQALANSQSSQVNIGVTPDPSLTSVTVKAAVLADTPDPDLTNNQASATVTFGPNQPTLNGGGFGCSILGLGGRGGAGGAPGVLVGLLLSLGVVSALRSRRRLGMVRVDWRRDS